MCISIKKMIFDKSHVSLHSRIPHRKPPRGVPSEINLNMKYTLKYILHTASKLDTGICNAHVLEPYSVDNALYNN